MFRAVLGYYNSWDMGLDLLKLILKQSVICAYQLISC